MFQNQANHMYKFEPFFLLYMYTNNVTKIGMPHGHNTKFGSNCTSLCIQTKIYMYGHPPYTCILFIPPFTATVNGF